MIGHDDLPSCSDREASAMAMLLQSVVAKIETALADAEMLAILMQQTGQIGEPAVAEVDNIAAAFRQVTGAVNERRNFYERT